MTTNTITQTIDTTTVQNQVQETLQYSDSRQAAQSIFDILTQTYKDIVEAPSEFQEQPLSASALKDPEARRYTAQDMDLMRNRLKEKAQRGEVFDQILYPITNEIKNSMHYEVFKTLVAKILAKQEQAYEAKNEYVYVYSRHTVSEKIRSIIK
ncbi:hypothetical protein KA037_06135 [Patescibacteria group bacterium]|jgi:hypothetical protein|nr:hypothetical protein [Patescibacteria group bacterium]MBP7842190.1 hypothetical protein [Patescibacteria group bacterium]